jgi:hypothetical protein
LAATYIQWLKVDWVIGLPTTMATDPAGMTSGFGLVVVCFVAVVLVLVRVLFALAPFVLVDDALPHPAARSATRAPTTIPTARRLHPLTVKPG